MVAEILLSSRAASGGGLSPVCHIHAIMLCQAWGLSTINLTLKTSPNSPFKFYLISLSWPEVKEIASAGSKDTSLTNKVLLKWLYSHSCFLLCFTSWWSTATASSLIQLLQSWFSLSKISSFYKQKGRRINEDANDLHSTWALRSPQALLGGQNILTGKLHNKYLLTWVCFFNCHPPFLVSSE